MDEDAIFGDKGIISIADGLVDIPEYHLEGRLSTIGEETENQFAPEEPVVISELTINADFAGLQSKEQVNPNKKEFAAGWKRSLSGAMK